MSGSAQGPDEALHWTRSSRGRWITNTCSWFSFCDYQTRNFDAEVVIVDQLLAETQLGLDFSEHNDGTIQTK